MKNKYEISQYEGLPFVEVRGASFSCDDLYEIVGKHQFMSTFNFKTGSDAMSKFGQSVTGVIFYDKNGLEAFNGLNQKAAEQEDRRVKIDSPMPELTIAQRENLKYGGILVTDIEFLSFMPYKQAEERHESGEKKVPNIIDIPYDGDYNVDCNILYQNYIVLKHNSGVELTPYEKEKLIGIIIGRNKGYIDSRVLNHFGFDLPKFQSCKNIWYHIYKTKESMGIISEEEKLKLADLEAIREMENIIKLIKEIKKSRVNREELLRSGPLFKAIMSSMSKFEPDILLHWKKQIFWDIDSYLHILLRHVKELQIGEFKIKSPFPYRFEDLKILIEKVIGTVEDEIKRHFEEKPGKDFKRVGRMSVLFNGDYYCLQIDKEGRLVNLYING
jgi:hypothetical protein